MIDSAPPANGLINLLVVVVLIVIGFHFFHHKTVWQANYEATTSNVVSEGPSFSSKTACLGYIHESHPSTTYGWECGSNCKRINSDENSPFVCDETAQ